jgi:very-short-patch-repair endonuclease
MIITKRKIEIANIKNIKELEEFISNNNLVSNFKNLDNINQVSLNNSIQSTPQISLKSFSRNFIRQFINGRTITTISYWFTRGYSLKETKNKISAIQSENGKISQQKLKALDKNSDEYYKTRNTTLRYWVLKGYSEEEAKQKLKERQSTFSKEKCIQKFGKTEGNKRFRQRQDKWINSLYANKTLEEIDKFHKSKSSSLEMCIKRYGKTQGLDFYKQKITNWQQSISKNDSFKYYSKWSMSIINELIKLYQFDGTVFYAPNEFMIPDNNKAYFYDFVLLKNKIILEFNGRMFHPNENMGTEEWQIWKKLFTGENADTSLAKDKRKEMVAVLNGFKVLKIWDNKTNKENLEIIKEFFKENNIKEKL